MLIDSTRTNEEVDDVIDESTDEIVPYKYTVTSYGADYTVDLYVQRLSKELIFIPPFQRSYVWSLNQASRFIESLLLGLPVPGVFLSKESDTEKMLIIDGQQRLKTLQFFYEGLFRGREFRLRGVQERFEGKNYKSLDESDKLRLGDSIIHATIVKQDEPSDDQSSIYHVFERLNTGGTQLQPQEIRACIYHGKFNNLLSELSKLRNWQTVYGLPSNRLKDQELILRFFALYFYFDNYKRPMKEFLNEYMGKNKNFNLQNEEDLKNIFIPTVDLIASSLEKRAFRPERAINAAVYDAVMVGLARRISQDSVSSIRDFNDKYRGLLNNEEFINSSKTSTSDEGNVNKRIKIATSYFQDLR